jgi:hypothetical protein
MVRYKPLAFYFSVMSSFFTMALPAKGGAVFKRAQRGLFGGKKRISGNNVSFSEIKFVHLPPQSPSSLVRSRVTAVRFCWWWQDPPRVVAECAVEAIVQ